MQNLTIWSREEQFTAKKNLQKGLALKQTEVLIKKDQDVWNDSKCNNYFYKNVQGSNNLQESELLDRIDKICINHGNEPEHSLPAQGRDELDGFSTDENFNNHGNESGHGRLDLHGRDELDGVSTDENSFSNHSNEFSHGSSVRIAIQDTSSIDKVHSNISHFSTISMSLNQRHRCNDATGNYIQLLFNRLIKT